MTPFFLRTRWLLLSTALLLLPLSVRAEVPSLVTSVQLSPGTNAYGPAFLGLNQNTHKLYAAGGSVPEAGSVDLPHGVSVIDPTSGKVTAGIDLGLRAADQTAFAPSGLVVDDSTGTNGNRIYVLGSYDTPNSSVPAVRVIDGATDSNLTTAATDIFLYGIFSNPPCNMVVNPATHKVYVVNIDGEVSVIDGATRALVKTVETNLSGNLFALAVNPTSNQVFVFGNDGTEAVLDGASDSLVSTVTTNIFVGASVYDPVNNRIDAIGIDLSDAESHVFTLYAIDGSSGALVASEATSITDEDQEVAAGALALDAATGTLYVGGVGDAILAVDATTLAGGKQVASGDAFDLVFDPTSKRLFFPDLDARDNALTVLDPASGSSSKITTGYKPNALALNGTTNRLYVADEQTAELTVLDGVSGNVLSRWPVPPQQVTPSQPIYRPVAASAVYNQVYLTHVVELLDEPPYDSFLDVVDGSTGAVSQIPLSTRSNDDTPLLALDDANHRLYVTGFIVDSADAAHGQVYVFDTATNALLATISDVTTLPGQTTPEGSATGIAVNPATRRVYLSYGFGRGGVTIIDGAANRIVTSFSLSDSAPTLPAAIAVNQKTNKIYVADAGDDNQVFVIDGATDTLQGSFANSAGDNTTPDFHSVYGIAVDEATNTVFLTDQGNGFTPTGSVNAYDGVTQQFEGKASLPDIPTRIVFDPSRQRLYVADDTSGTVSILTTGIAHPPFFTGEAALANGVYYLALPDGNPFGYYSYFSDPHYIYHFDLGYEYVFDAADGYSGVYLYDFASNDFFYTSPGFPFPYLYDFGLNSVVYYYPDPNHAGHYNTDGVRYFYVFNTGKIISK